MITFIILTKNHPEYLRRCLESLAVQTWQCWNAIVIDTSNSAELLENQTICLFFGCKINHWPYVIESGFAAKNNMGIQEALKDPECKFICLLNDDAFPGPDFIKDMINIAAKYPDVHSFSPLFLYANEPEKVQAMGGGKFSDKFPCGEFQYLNNVDFSKLCDSDLKIAQESIGEPTFLDCGYGAAIVYRREVFEKIGFLDENFRHGFDEPDFAKRMKLQNLKILYAPTIVYHVCGGSSKNKTFWQNLPNALAMNRARLYFLMKHYPIDFVIKTEFQKVLECITKPKSLLIEKYSILWNIFMAIESRMAYHDLYDPKEPSKFEKEEMVKKGIKWKRPKVSFKLKILDFFVTYSLAIGLLIFCAILYVAEMMF